MNILILSLVFLPMIGALPAYFSKNRLQKFCCFFFAAVSLGISAALLFSENMTVELPEICSLGLRFELDGFRKVYAVVISFAWLMTFLLSPEYFAHHGDPSRYYFFNLLTLGATLGVFLAADLSTAFIFFEIMSFTSFTWVIHEETDGAVRAANTYLAVAVIGGLVALMGLFLLHHELGTTEISGLYALAQKSPNKPTLFAAGCCILFGFGAKAGMFPLHIWLPKAHPVAPAPASALLSGVLTKSGIWGILAISANLFREDPAWGTLILALGTVTMVLGALLALFSVDLKRTLACSSMSQIGFILVGIGCLCLLGEENALAARGALLHMMNHSIFKTVLFACAGIVYMNAHTLDLNELRGFGRKKPLLRICFLSGALGIGGIPLFSGYVSKTLLHEGIVETAHAFGGAFLLHLVEWLFLISGGMTLAYMTKLFVALFVDRNPEKQAEGEEKPAYAKFPAILSILCPAVLIPVLGACPGFTMDRIADLGTDFFHPGELAHAVSYFSLENLKGALISLMIGAVLYFGLIRCLLMKEGRYLDRWNKKIDLEDILYRPLILRWLPGIFGAIASAFGENKVTGPFCRACFRFISSAGALFGENKATEPAAKAVFRTGTIATRGVGDLLDASVFALRKTAFRDSPPPSDEKLAEHYYFRIGDRIDRLAVKSGKERKGGHHYARLFVRVHTTLLNTFRAITGNLSFALLMLIAAIVLVFLYIFVVRN